MASAPYVCEAPDKLMAAAGARVLVIDPMASLRKATAAQLRALGAGTVLEAGDASDALAQLSEQHVDLVIADCDLHGLPGPQLLEAVRGAKAASAAEVVLVVADRTDPRVAGLLASGARQVLARPLERPALEAVLASLPAKAAQARRHRLLVVDDSPTALLQTVRSLENDFELITCDSGLKAIELCRAEPAPELVLLDVTMPEIDGFETLTRLRQDPRTARIPVIFVSAMTAKSFRLKGLALGALDYIAKPVIPEILRLQLRNLLQLLAERRK